MVQEIDLKQFFPSDSFDDIPSPQKKIKTQKNHHYHYEAIYSAI